MKKLAALVVLALTVSTSAFASDVVGRGVKDAGKDTGKAVAVTAKDTGKAVTVAVKDTAKAGVRVVKFLV